jgi:catechol 2,3-dioxygenase-like lactoylglutathione lyase family enzyme
MHIHHVTPILNVSDVVASIAWFEQLGWERGFTWNDGGSIDGAADANEHGPAGFGSVRTGHAEIFLCLDGQGAPGGVWLSWWLPTPEDVDALHATALERGMTVTFPPTDEPWGVREFHLRHPEGHTFRVSAPLR